MKTFFVTYFKKSKAPSQSGVFPSEEIKAISKEDVPGELYQKLKLSKEDFNKDYVINEIKEIIDPN